MPQENYRQPPAQGNRVAQREHQGRAESSRRVKTTVQAELDAKDSERRNWKQESSN